MSDEMDRERRERFMGRVFARAYCDAPVREGETPAEADDAIIAAAPRVFGIALGELDPPAG